MCAGGEGCAGPGSWADSARAGKPPAAPVCYFCGMNHLRMGRTLAGVVLVVLGLVGGSARASRPEIEQLLHEMQVAVLTGDHAGYLKLVDSADPVFLQEQRMWAEDLKTHVPESFSIAIKDAAEQKEWAEAKDAAAEPAVKIGDGSAEAPIEISWALKGWKEPRKVSWTARFRKGEMGWVYAGEKWNKLSANGVLVLYADGLEESAQAVADVLPEVRKHVHAGFGYADDSPIAKRVQQVKMYGSMQHLQESIYLSYTDGLSGWNEPEEAVKLLVGRKTNRGGLRPLLAHEYGHVATFELGRARMPWWILEGVAELSAEEFGKSREQNDRTVRHWKAAGQLPAFEEMKDFDARAKKWYGQVYGQGHHMLGYISDKFGREKRVEWLRTQAQGASLDDATKSVLGLSFEELDKEWRDSIGPEEKKEEKQEEPKQEGQK